MRLNRYATYFAAKSRASQSTIKRVQRGRMLGIAAESRIALNGNCLLWDEHQGFARLTMEKAGSFPLRGPIMRVIGVGVVACVLFAGCGAAEPPPQRKLEELRGTVDT